MFIDFLARLRLVRLSPSSWLLVMKAAFSKCQNKNISDIDSAIIAANVRESERKSKARDVRLVSAIATGNNFRSENN
jgi:hypothetical protein